MLVAVRVFFPNYAQIMLAFQNYATFLKNYSIVYPGQVVQALVYPLCSRNLVNYLDVSSLHLTGLAWRPPF